GDQRRERRRGRRVLGRRGLRRREEDAERQRDAAQSAEPGRASVRASVRAIAAERRVLCPWRAGAMVVASASRASARTEKVVTANGGPPSCSARRSSGTSARSWRTAVRSVNRALAASECRRPRSRNRIRASARDASVSERCLWPEPPALEHMLGFASRPRPRRLCAPNRSGALSRLTKSLHDGLSASCLSCFIHDVRHPEPDFSSDRASLPRRSPSPLRRALALALLALALLAGVVAPA